MTPGTRRLLTACLLAIGIAAPLAASRDAQAPTWPTQPTRDYQEGDAVNVAFQVTEHASGGVTYAASGLPAGLTINANSGLVTGTLTPSTVDMNHPDGPVGNLDGAAGSHLVTLTATRNGISSQTSFTWRVSRFRKGDLFAGVGKGRYEVFDENGNFKYLLITEVEGVDYWDTGSTTGCGYNWFTRKMYFTGFDVDQDPTVIEIDPVPVSADRATAFPRTRISTYRDTGLERGGTETWMSVDNAPESVTFGVQMNWGPDHQWGTDDDFPVKAAGPDGELNTDDDVRAQNGEAPMTFMYVGHAGGSYNESWLPADEQDRPVVVFVSGVAYYANESGGQLLDGQGNPIPYPGGGINRDGILERTPGVPYPGNPRPIIQWGNDLQRFTFDRDTFEATRSAIFEPHGAYKGVDWSDLASDQRTLFYTSEWGYIYRYNVGPGLEGNDPARQLDEYTRVEGTNTLYAIRLLPPGDGSGGLVVAAPTSLLRIDDDGRVLTQYDAPNVDTWFALNITPDGRYMWSAETQFGKLFKWEISSGTLLAEVQTRATAPAHNPTRKDLDGLCIMGEYTAAQEICGDGVDNDGDGQIDELCQPIEACSSSSPGDDDGDGLVDYNDPDCGATTSVCAASGYTDASVAGYCARHNYEGDIVVLNPAPPPPAVTETYEVSGVEVTGNNVVGLPPGISFSPATGVATGVPQYETISNDATAPRVRTWRITVGVTRRNASNEIIAEYDHEFDWTIENRNRAPIATPHTLSARPNVAISVNAVTDTATATGGADTDPDTEDVSRLQIVSVTQPANGTASFTGNVVTYTPNQNYQGSDSFTYTISDRRDPALTSTATISIVMTNQPPVVVGEQITTRPGLTTNVSVLDNDSDPDGDTLTLSIISTPARGTFVDNGNGNFTYTPPNPYTGQGNEDVIYRLTDPFGQSRDGRVLYTVINRRPNGVDDVRVTKPGVPVTINVFANDTDPDNDPDILPAGPDPQLLRSFTQPANGTITNNGGVFTYTSNMSPVFLGTDTFQYTFHDSYGGEHAAMVRITVANQPPVAVDDARTTRPGVAITIPVLTNDSDPDPGDTLTHTTNTNPSNGTITKNPDGTFTYTSNPGFVGVDTFRYTITDGYGAFSTATVTITVVNVPPVAEDDSYSIIAGQTLPPFDVQVNDPRPDADGDTVTIQSFTQPGSGTVTRLPNGTFQYQQPNGYSGVTTFTYTVTDGYGGTDTATVTIRVINNPPIAVDDTATTNGTRPVAISVLLNDSDPDSHVISVTGATTPPNGSVVVNANGTITYTANEGFQGTDTFFYTIRDGFGGESTARVTVTIGPPNRFDDCTCATARANPGEIWPPNHKQTEVVNITNLTDPDSGQPLAIRILGIYQDEPTNYLGDGDTTIDAGGVGTSTAWVRAERTGNPNVPGNGRVYEIVFEATAPDGSHCQGRVFTGVPHDQGQGNYIYDDGIRYDSTVAGGPIVRNALKIENGLTDADVTAREFQARYVAEARIGNSFSSTTREMFLGPSNDTDADTENFTWNDNQDVTFLLWRTGNEVHFKLITSSQFEWVSDSISCTGEQCNDIFIRAQTNSNTEISLRSLNLNGVNIPDTLTLAPGDSPRSLHLSGLMMGEGALLSGIVKMNWSGSRPSGSAVNFKVQVGKACPTGGTSGGGGTGTPPLARTDTYATQEDTPLIVSAAEGVLPNDLTFAGPLTASLVDPPSNGTVTLNANGSFTYTPNPGFNGQDTYRYRVNDGSLYSDPALVTILVTPVPDPPNAVDDAATTPERTPVTIAVLTNDSDWDGGAVTLTSIASQPSNGTAVVTGSTIVYTPANGFIGTDTFTYTITGDEGTDTATVTVTVTNVNEPPVAVNNAYTTQEDTPLTITAPGILANDSDPDAGDTFVAVLVTNPSNGTLTQNANGSFTYTPNPNFSGTDSYTYRVRDAGGLESNVATVTITITPMADPPVAVNDAYTVVEDGVLQINAPGVKDNDSDPDTPVANLVVTMISGATRGTVTLAADGSFVYTPFPNVSGADTFTYRLNDGALDSNIATVTIAITEVPDPPVAVDDAATTQEDTPVTIPVLPNDSDPDGSTLTVQSVTQGQNGSVSIVGNQARYTPNANFSGVDVFTYTITDGTSTATAKVTVTVTAVNDPPTAQPDAYSTPRDTTLNVQTPGVLTNDSDPDSSQTLTAILVTQPANGKVTALQTHGAFAYQPNSGFVGTDTFTYKVSDGTAESAPTTVTITVTETNRPPVAVNDSYSTNRNTALTIAAPGILSNDSDPDAGNTLTVQLISGTAANTGTVVVNPNGSFTFTPATDFTGTTTFRYRARDNHNAQSNEAIVTITVTAVNRPPVAVNNSYTTNKNTALTVQAPGILGDDSDPDTGDTITAVLGTGPTAAMGTLALNANGSFTFTPANNFVGTATYTYRARDNHNATSSLATVTITVEDKGPQSGQVCYDGGSGKTQYRAYLDWNRLDNGDIKVRATVSRNYADNTYGINKIGWGNKKRDFPAVYRSDYGQLAFYNANNSRVLEFRIDYLSPLSGTPSGYGSRGITSGTNADGGMVAGTASNIVSMATSMDLNMNAFGYVSTASNHPLKSYSPATNTNYAVNQTYPLWIWDMWYEATVKASTFGSSGFGSVRLNGLHASPSKADVTTWRQISCQ